MTTGDGLPAAFDLRRMSFDDLPGVFNDDLTTFWVPFLASCEAIARRAPELRLALEPTAAHREASRQALALGDRPTAQDIKTYLKSHFLPHHIVPREPERRAFFTAYYRPEIPASRTRSANFSEPLLARPDDLVTLRPGEDVDGLNGLSSARRRPDGGLDPFPTRAQIEAGALGDSAQPLAYVADAIEAFMIHVQGSARLLLDDGHALDLTYAGRNGQPYTSIGKILIERGDVEPSEMSLDRLKAWVRESGQQPGAPGRALLQTNRSYIFFSVAEADPTAAGPIGAAGLPLTPLRSIAVDRTIWPYGLPFWIDVQAPWPGDASKPFRRLAVGQDTGSAIVGPARADLFFGDGAEAGRLAGAVRHHGQMIALLPRGDAR